VGAPGKFRKKPVVIDAIQWTGKNYSEVCRFIGYEVSQITTFAGPLVIQTLEGQMLANDGDWIIRGVKGEFYPCKPDIFAATYDAVVP